MEISLEHIKKHLNVDEYYNGDDAYIESLVEVAFLTVEKHIDKPIGEIALANDGKIPAPLLHAILLLVAHLYNQREAVAFASSSEVPLAYTYLLDLYKNYNNIQNNEDKQ